MSAITDEIDQQLRELEQLAGESGCLDQTVEEKSTKSRFSIRGLFIGLMLLLSGILTALLMLPRFVLAFHASTGLVYLSVALSFISLAIGLILILLISAKIVTGRLYLHSWLLRGVFLIISVFSIYSLVYLSNANVKEDEIRSAFLDLHPALRIGLTTVILADSDLIITDISRTPEDYRRWGLPPRERSLHYKQPSTGFVHALDLRTINRPEWLNRISQFLFEVMGFHTYRHIGTADHLHVSIPFEK